MLTKLIFLVLLVSLGLTANGDVCLALCTKYDGTICGTT